MSTKILNEIKSLYRVNDAAIETELRAELAERVTFRIVKGLGLRKPWQDKDTKYLHAYVTAARVGVQPYPNHPRLGSHASYRDKLFIKQLSQRLVDKPLVMGHYDIKPGKNQEHTVGWISESFERKGLTVCHVVIDNAELIDRILQNEDASVVEKVALGLSVGYDTEMKKVEGVWFDKEGLAGVPGQSYSYSYQQLDPRPNHLAIVPIGRGGPVLRFADGAEECDEFSAHYESPVPLLETVEDAEDNWFSVFATSDSGSQINPYPDSHVNAKFRRKSMAETNDNAQLGYDALHSRVGKIEDSLKSLEDSLKNVNDMPTVMDGLAKKYDTLNDALGNITNFISELRNAYSSQDRPSGREEAAQEEMKAGIHSVKFVKDAAPSADEVEARVAETAQLYVTHKDELVQAGVKDFTLSPDQIKSKVLELHGVAVPTYDSASDAAIALRTAYDTFMVTRDVQKEAETKRNKLEDAFKEFSGATSPAPKTEETESYAFGRHNLNDDGSLGFDMHKDGSVTYDL